MSAIFGETLTFGQENGPSVRLVVAGDEYYARYETLDGFTVVYDPERGLFCYAIVVNGRLVSSGLPMTETPPPGVRRHVEDSEAVRQERFQERRAAALPPPQLYGAHDTLRTFGPNRGLLTGRRVSTGTVRGLTILVEFQDVSSTVTAADVSDMLNGQDYTANGNFCSVREYFRTVSSGKLDYSNVVVGPYRLSRNRQYYTTNLLVPEALNLAVAAGLDLRQFDSRGEGVIDAISIMYAGQTQYLDQLWPHNSYIDLRFGNMRTYFYMLTSMGRSSADLSIGTFCHESGHMLCRFPDIYDYGNRDGDGVESAGIGSYCLMGSGNHLNRGRTPSPVCAYLRDLAGWCDTVIPLNQSAEYQAEHGAYDRLLKFETDKLNEYFLVENRTKIALDQHLPSSGLAVYHCDTLGSNEWQEGSSGRHYQVALLQADGRLDLERNINQGDGTDLYGTVAGVALSHATRPASRQWDGADSGLIISGIGSPGPVVRFRVGPEATTPTIRVEEAASLTIPDDNRDGVRSTITIQQPGTVQQIRISVDITHTYVGDLVIELLSPSNQRVTLHNRNGGSQDNLITVYDPATVPALAALIGQPVQGAWALTVRDVAGLDVGKLNRWSLEVAVEVGEQTVSGEASPALPIPDNDPGGVSSVIALAHPGIVRELRVGLEITHTYIGDLRVELQSPAGRSIVLHSRQGGSEDDLRQTFDSSPPSPLAPLIGQAIQGDWILRVTDQARRDVGTLNAWSIEVTAG